jgi:GNAT superfamily N-acetyltransferase
LPGKFFKLRSKIILFIRVPVNRELIALIKTNMPFVSRPALMSDQDAIAQLSAQWGYPVSAEKLLLVLSEILQHPDHQIVLLEYEREVAGWIHGIYSYRLAADPFVEIVGLVVDARRRRMGMGKFLVHEIIQWAKTRNCSLVRVKCHIVRKEANIFYSGMGFQEIKQQKVYDLFL